MSVRRCLMISVAMATYNGKRYIKEQLDSIINQTKLPDEIVIRDDFSKDGTFEFLINYSKKYPNIKWDIKQNKVNVGYKKNFYAAIIACRGDYIFLSDQDDIWLKDKIAVMLKQMEKGKLLLLMSNLKSFYQDGCKNRVKEERLGLRKIKKSFNLNHCVNTPRPGCSFCISKELVNLYKENIDFTIPHDNLLWHIASLQGRVWHLNRVTMKYRRHDTNASNNKKNSRQKRLEAIQEQIRNIEYMINISEGCKEKKFFLRQKIVFENRLKNLKEKNMIKLILSVKNIKYYYTLRLYFVDIYYSLRGEI